MKVKWVFTLYKSKKIKGYLFYGDLIGVVFLRVLLITVSLLGWASGEKAVVQP